MKIHAWLVTPVSTGIIKLDLRGASAHKSKSFALWNRWRHLSRKVNGDGELKLLSKLTPRRLGTLYRFQDSVCACIDLSLYFMLCCRQQIWKAKTFLSRIRVPFPIQRVIWQVSFHLWAVSFPFALSVPKDCPWSANFLLITLGSWQIERMAGTQHHKWKVNCYLRTFVSF